MAAGPVPLETYKVSGEGGTHLGHVSLIAREPREEWRAYNQDGLGGTIRWPSRETAERWVREEH